jgi:hypothetical protein
MSPQGKQSSIFDDVIFCILDFDDALKWTYLLRRPFETKQLRVEDLTNSAHL